MDNNEITRRFKYHQPDEARVKQHEAARGKCWELALFLNNTLPDCQEKEDAIKALDERVLFLANAAIARAGR